MKAWMHILFLLVFALLGWGCPSTSTTVKKNEAPMSRLRRQLRSPDASVRKQALEELKQFGDRAAPAMPALRRAMLQDRNPGVRQAALKALIAIGPKAIPTWMVALVSRDPVLKKLAEDGMSQLQPRDSAMLSRSLSSPLLKVRESTLKKLQEFGAKATPAMPVLIQLLEDREVEVKESAASALGMLGPAAAKAVPALSQALAANKAWWRVRVAIARSLGQIGEKSASAAAELAELMRDKDSDVGRAAMQALIKIGPAAVPGLNEAIKDSSWQVKLQVAKLFALMGPKAAGGVPALVRSVEDSDTEVRKAAVIALGRIGPQAHAGIPLLTQLLHNQKEERIIWKNTVLALVRIGPKGHHVLLQAMQHKELWWLPNKVSEMLGELGKKLGKPGIPLLRKALLSPKWEVRLTTTMIIRKLGASAALTTQELRKALADKDDRVKKGAIKALGAIGHGAKDALPDLQKLSQNKATSEDLRSVAQSAISQIKN